MTHAAKILSATTIADARNAHNGDGATNQNAASIGAATKAMKINRAICFMIVLLNKFVGATRCRTPFDNTLLNTGLKLLDKLT